MSQTLEAALKIRQDADAAMEDLRTECGLGDTANMKQCLRVLLQRLAASPQVNSMAIQNEHGVSVHLLLLLLLPPTLTIILQTLQMLVVVEEMPTTSKILEIMPNMFIHIFRENTFNHETLTKLVLQILTPNA
jgi:hypothetical protein